MTRGLIDIEVLELLRKRGMKPLTLGMRDGEASLLQEASVPTGGR